ncbi:Glutamate Aspartate periplasmic binding protein precursor GltI [Liberibacter crescens BT-1]|uniref:Glutamate Aspartate periplasmic binding protein GltI n=1 Tax=Liberibacter crescens (strain BT-1) TaxID=1215343 RepID=L0EVJ2_LIBCB|nr:amino acid ABC transporter substrate-binding protein [Liberibacter crescens]AGA64875.1 Glutamate Aspartate periplasmic binding protein precursor GltI [Liberibacter crescens BT-1]AMC12915.1 amino acid ABC transporter substrate-bindnig protein [Liberibacter crescens]
MFKKILLAIISISITGFSSYNTLAATLLDNIKERGHIKCGINSGVAGFSQPDSNGNWQGFDVDFCKAIASAIFNDPSKVKYTALSAKERFTALQSGQIDVLSRNTTWTLSRDTSLGFNFRPITYYDGQSFMTHKNLNVKSITDLSGASICVQAGTTTEMNMSDYFRSHNLKYNPTVFEKVEEVNAAYDSGRCDAYTADKSALYTFRLTLKNPDEHVILNETISKEPLGPLVRHGDDQWFDIVSWVHYAMINAEDFGITKANVDQMRNSDNPDIRRFLGNEANSTLGAGLGLTEDWAYNIIKNMGNYGEVFDHNIGSGSNLKIPRGLNKLWNKGGIQYAPPVR